MTPSHAAESGIFSSMAPVEHEVVPGCEQPQGIDLPAQDRPVPPAFDQSGERGRLARIEIVDEIVQADEIEAGLAAAKQALDCASRFSPSRFSG